MNALLDPSQSKFKINIRACSWKTNAGLVSIQDCSRNQSLLFHVSDGDIQQGGGT